MDGARRGQFHRRIRHQFDFSPRVRDFITGPKTARRGHREADRSTDGMADSRGTSPSSHHRIGLVGCVLRLATVDSGAAVFRQPDSGAGGDKADHGPPALRVHAVGDLDVASVLAHAQTVTHRPSG